MTAVEYGEGTRVYAGRLTLDAEPGTILGPMWTREYLVAVANEGGQTVVGYATQADIDMTRERLSRGEAPRSVAEWDWIKRRQAVTRGVRAALAQLS